MATADELWAWIYPAIEDLRSDYESDQDKSWDSRKEIIFAKLGIPNADSDPLVAALVYRLDELPEDERNRILGSDQLQTMVRELVEDQADHTAAQETGAQESSVPAYDEGAWQAYVAANGSQWDGTEPSWPAFRQWFEYYAVQQGLSAAATGWLDWLETVGVTERIGEFARYGVTIVPAQAAGPSGAPASSEESGDEFGWVAADQREFLQRQWGQDWPALLAQDLDARWGGGWQANPGEHKAAWLADLIAAGAFAGGQESGGQESGAADGQEAAQQAVLDDFATRVSQIPGIEQLSQEEIAQIIAEEINR